MFESLTDDDPSVMAIMARRQVNQVAVTTKKEQTPVMANLDPITAEGAQHYHLLILHKLCLLLT